MPPDLSPIEHRLGSPSRTIEPIKHLSVEVAIAVCAALFQFCTPGFYEATLRIEPQGSVIIFDRRKNSIAWKAIATI
jgi:hypothetical protein